MSQDMFIKIYITLFITFVFHLLSQNFLKSIDIDIEEFYRPFYPIVLGAVPLLIWNYMLKILNKYSKNLLLIILCYINLGLSIIEVRPLLVKR